MSEVYELKKGLEIIKQRISEAMEGNTKPIIVGVAGGSGSGKTTKVAQKIKGMFPGSEILSTDDYTHDAHTVVEITGCRNFDDPRAYKLDLLGQHLDALKRSESIAKPIYSHSQGYMGKKAFYPKRIITLEGIYALYPGIVEKLDLKIFVDVAIHGSLIRRIIRDVARTGQTEEQILEQYVKTVYPMFKLHIEPTKDLADIVVINQYIPEKEADRCESHEIQIKVVSPGMIEEKLKNLGFTEAGTVCQEDTYFSAPNWPDDYGDELMRIRHEGGKYFLAYKGPEESSDFRIRPKKEFEVKPSLKDALRALGYKEILSFTKSRKKFLGDDLEAAIDEFTDGRIFLELRTTDPKGEAAIDKCLDELGINKLLIIKESYLELMRH